MAIAPPAMVEAAGYAADRLAVSLSTGGRGTAGGRLALRNGILAWWACEEGWRWPPNSRNNPGNIRPGLESSRAIGTDAKNFLIFRTPRDGVDAFVDLILRGSMYQGIRTAIANILVGQADSSALATAVGRSPWGTNAPCMLGAVVVTQAVGATPTGTNWAGGAPTSTSTSSPSPIATPVVAQPFDCTAFQGHLRRLGIPSDRTHTFTQAEADRIAAELYNVRGDVAATIASRYVGKTVADVCEGRIETGDPFNDLPLTFEGIAGAIAGIPAAMGFVLAQASYLGAILILIILGLWLIARSE